MGEKRGGGRGGEAGEGGEARKRFAFEDLGRELAERETEASCGSPAEGGERDEECGAATEQGGWKRGGRKERKGKEGKKRERERGKVNLSSTGRDSTGRQGGRVCGGSSVTRG